MPANYEEWIPGTPVEVRERPNLRGTVMGWKWSGDLGSKLIKVRLLDPPEVTWFMDSLLKKLDAIDLLGRIADD